MSLLSRGQAALVARQQVAATSGNAIRYTRGAVSVDLTGKAWVGRTVFASNLDGGARVEWGDRDYLIPVADLAMGSPQMGDRVTETIGGVDVVFEVQTPDTGEPAERFSDQGRTVYRVHTKQVDNG